MRYLPLKLVRRRTYRALLEEVERLGLEAHALRGELAAARARLRELGDPEAPPACEALDHAAGGLTITPRLAGETGDYAEPPAPMPGDLASFHVLDGWTTQFLVEGERVGGTQALGEDARLDWLLAVAGGVEGRAVLELGPMEGAHTRTMLARGAASVVAVEGFRPAWLRCLVVKEIFGLARARFLYGDFARWVAAGRAPRVDVVAALGVLYHQENPAALLHDLAGVAGTLLLWTHVAGDGHPEGARPGSVEAGGRRYPVRRHRYGGMRDRARNFCGGVVDEPAWMSLETLRTCLDDAGWSARAEHVLAPGEGPGSVLVVARREGPAPRSLPFPLAPGGGAS